VAPVVQGHLYGLGNSLSAFPFHHSSAAQLSADNDDKSVGSQEESGDSSQRNSLDEGGGSQ
jgi:hypothetical protein